MKYAINKVSTVCATAPVMTAYGCVPPAQVRLVGCCGGHMARARQINSSRADARTNGVRSNSVGSPTAGWSTRNAAARCQPQGMQ